MAATMIPLIGFAGSAIDMARLYVVKARLQQACDAGVLAGRKTMTDMTMATPLDPTATKTAQTFFANNFRGGWFQNTNAVFTPTKATQGTSAFANEVYGTANVNVPMTLMQFFGVQPVQLAVTCQAIYDTGDTDVMFVLDVTGSMSCYPSDPDSCATQGAQFTRDDNTLGYYNPEKPATTDSNNAPMYAKLESLRRAVLQFDSTIRPVIAADPTSHIRYGFVPYNSAVNIGYQIPSGYLQNTNWTYQSRQPNRDYNFGSTSNFTLTGIPKTTCVAQRYPATGYVQSGPTWNNSYYSAMYYTPTSWNGTNGGTCSGTQQPLRAVWRYQPYTLDVSQYATGNAINNPSRLDGSTSKWRGCVEEVNTIPASSFSLSSLPDDLNPDFIPSSPSDKWRPMWQDAVWYRSQSPQDVNDDQISEDYNSPFGYWQYYAMQAGMGYNYSYGITHLWDQYSFAACPKAAQRLTQMSASQVQSYVYDNDFKPGGGTYHDVGMNWGTRMLSPNGVFASDTAAWPGRPAPRRAIIFLTDGGMAPVQQIYGEYGLEQFDQRVDAGGNSSTDLANHTARFRIECDAAKARGITVYTIALGTAVTSDLTYCASPGQSFSAYNTTALTQAFSTIAQRLSSLRINQ